MKPGSELIVDLLPALVRDGRQLDRLLSMAGLGELTSVISPDRPFRDSAHQVIQEAERYGSLDRLLEALIEWAPGRRADVELAAERAGIVLPGKPAPSSEPPPEPPRAEAARGAGATAVDAASDAPPIEVPAEYASYLAKLGTVLRGLRLPSDAETPPVDADPRWPWIAAAAVLGGFRPAELLPLGAATKPGDAVTQLSTLVVIAPDGRWVLTNAPRDRALAELVKQGRLAETLEVNAQLPDARRDWMRRLLAQERPALAELAPEALQDVEAVVSWLEPLGVSLPVRREEIRAIRERRALIAPLRALVGAHFRGRQRELELLSHHLHGATPRDTLVMWGPGGVGKSSLVGKVLLDLEAQPAPPAFAYLDFDRAQHDPRSGRNLLVAITRQIRLLYSTAVEVARGLAALESAYADGATNADSILSSLPGALPTSAGAGEAARPEEIARLAGALREVKQSLGHDRPTLALVLDTFEEVQVQGEGAVKAALEFVGLLHDGIPDLRVLISGRGPVAEVPGPPLTLGDLDAESADAVLENLGVGSGAVRRRIVERFGANPLTLRRAANAIHDAKVEAEMLAPAPAGASAEAAVAAEEVQTMLYGRILGHIKDLEVRAISHPGLVVRLVDADVIREVLAAPCAIDPARADDLFDRLARHISLFERSDDGKALVHRQDVRRLMLRPIMEDADRKQQVAAIHAAAVEHYAKQPSSAARAEELYHRLMRGEAPRTLDHLWSDALRVALASAWEEPLPATSRAWLGPRLGVAPASDRDLWEQQEWEVDAAARARSWLLSKKHREALEVLAERQYRLDGSRLLALEAEAWLGLGELAKAERALARGIEGASRLRDREAELELLRSSVRLRAARGEPEAVAAAAEAAAAIAERLSRPLDALEIEVDALQSVASMSTPAAGAQAARARIVERLAKRFLALPGRVLGERPELVRRAVKLLGSERSDVVVHAAVELGERPRELHAVFRDDAYALGTLFEEVFAGSKRAELDDLSRQLGLAVASQSRDPLLTIASMAVRTGRLGTALALTLDHAADPAGIRERIVGTLIQDAATL
jgi:hypothetical protein